MIWDNFSEAQRNRLAAEEEAQEIKALDMGVARYRELRARSMASVMTPEQKVISAAMSTLVPAIERVQADVLAGRPMKGVTKWGLPLLSLAPEKLALLTLAVGINQASTYQLNTLPTVAMAVAEAVKNEREFELLKKTAPDVFNMIRRRVKRWNRRSLRMAKKKAEGVDAHWDRPTRAYIGAKLLELAIEYTDVFDYRMIVDRGKRIRVLDLKDSVRQTLEKQHKECELLTPYYLPMVVPPNDWKQGEFGGYHFHRYPLVKAGISEDLVKRPPQENMPLVYEAVNAIQQTAWRINRQVLSVMQEAWQAGGNLGNLPPAEPLDLPPLPADFEYNPESKKAWKLQAVQVHNENARLVSKRKSILTKLWIADRFKDYEAIWFPHQLDWRGRIYPVPSQLHPQSDDCGRALLEFAEAQPLGEDGFWWLSIHLANCFGVDKVSFQERYDWVNKIYINELTACAKDPFENRFWCQADDPWMALAAIFEWEKALQWKKRGKDSEYLSRLPVSIDGSCNGLQHLSALGLDEVGGRATNLIPSDIPQDIYSEVALKANEIIDAHLDDPDKHELAAAWAGRVDRNTVKRAVMTTPYGVTQAGIKNQFIADGHCDGLDGNLNDLANYLKDVVYEAVGTVVVAARRYMDWFREVARIAGEAGHAIRWTTPVGFPVVQEYLETSRRNVWTTLQRITLHEPKKSRNLSVAKQVRGLPPNYVHSLDAAHLMLTVLDAKDHGIKDFGMVHDSYATHAGQVKLLGTLLRRQFVWMYKYNILEDFKEKVEHDTGLTLPPLPPKGSLNLEQVNDSPYFFH